MSLTSLDIVTIHGWALSPLLWKNLENALQESLPTCRLRFHHHSFYAEKPLPHLENPVILAHSLGALWFLHERKLFPERIRAFISVAGFPRFCVANDFPYGTKLRPLVRMLEQFRSKGDVVVQDFLVRAAYPYTLPPELAAMSFELVKASRDKLETSLTWLRDWDARAALSAADLNIFALGMEDDLIVPASLAKTLMYQETRANEENDNNDKDEIRFAKLATGGHLALYFSPSEVAESIVPFLRRVL